MLKNLIFLILFLPFTGFCQEPFLLCEQEFVKVGKKEIYEQEKKSWIQEFGTFSKKKQTLPTYAVFDHESLQYMYLTPVNSFADVATYQQKETDFKNSFSKEEWAKKALPRESTLNFRVLTFHEYLAQSSYLPSDEDNGFLAKPYLHYYVYGVNPGHEEDFENSLKKLAGKHLSEKSSATWRVWKVLFGADIPKYIICIFAKNKVDREKQIKALDFISSEAKEDLRRDREGDAEIRRDLSLIGAEK
jgi:hypothetical protein